ncbi:hypothetical protein COCCU_10160 [Corynebacterium occultum]|uniref:Uncharacterized protein n=1 Tax=Corynebacterium occultum TaxID=2675219 RepID=A0A6B8W5U1_9CORY|nr:hypothetical protein [Corynebacterium occultum]QGU07951.1 hypothetical protein COCCU_10160 [Corynebacterium occultum]
MTTRSPITVRRRAAALARSRAVAVCIIFVVLLLPILYGLLTERSRQSSGTWQNAYAIAALAPALGITAAVLSLAVVLYRRSRPILEIGEVVKIPHSGVSFPLEELDTVQLWSRGATYITLLPDHVPERVPHFLKQVASYSVRLPDDVTPRPFELTELIKARRGEVQIDKLGVL